VAQRGSSGRLEGASEARPGSREQPLSVATLVKAAGVALDSQVGTVWVEGEVGETYKAASGHLYFTLKDAGAQIRAVMWRSDAGRLAFAIEGGLRLRCRGRLGIYDRDGKMQLYVQTAEPAGAGADALAFEQLKARLAAEGLFDPARKRPLPTLPRRIGLVTSIDGAAVRDVIRAVQRRFPVPILVADCRVQGPTAPASIARALAAIGATGVDVIIVGRGGGSASDLAAFNDEQVVRAVAAAPVPIISAVGHEVDTSLSDLAADVRAATPTMAGEMAVPVLADLYDQLRLVERRLRRELDHAVGAGRQDIDQLRSRADHRVHEGLAARRRALGDIERRLEAGHPRARLSEHRGELARLEERCRVVVRRLIADRQRSLGGMLGRLDAMSPLAVLERGYAIASRGERALRDAAEATVGDAVAVRLRRGQLDCRVEAVHREGEP
jgi:exodeoxyribonuclease VII large subunit